MNCLESWIGTSFLAVTLTGSGCGFQRPPTTPSSDLAYYQTQATKIGFPDVQTPQSDELMATREPLSVLDESNIQFEYLTLQDAVRTALQNSKVMRDLGGVLLRAPGSAVSKMDVALQDLDPRFGIGAALSDFDTTFSTGAFFEKNDKAINNAFLGGGTTTLKQDFFNYQTQLTKRAATGTQFTGRTTVEYDSNNSPANQFESAFTSFMELQARHPLWRGGGAEYLRIAGASGSPGSLNGVVLARINTDISLAQFEAAVRDFVSNVENAYWDLYFAYRDLDSKILARNAALQTWNSVYALNEQGKAGGEADKEAQAREQYYRFQDQVQNALGGKLTDSTQVNNGAAGGSFRGNGGVMTAERRLRLILGERINDGKLFRPADEPIEARVMFDWESSLYEALQRRPDLRRQKWIIKRREKELVASQNFLLPQFDLVGRYRWRGFGKDLIAQGQDSVLLVNGVRSESFDNSVENLFGGNFQEWQLGFEFSYPLGNRRGHAAVQHAEMQLARERAILAEQERDVVHQLSNSVADMKRGYALMQTNEERRLAAAAQLEAVQVAYDAGKSSLDLLLRAQQAYVTSETDYYRALVEYTLAIRNVHYEKGSLLEYNEIFLTEDLWPSQAYDDAANRQRLKVPLDWLDGFIHRDEPVSQGDYIQHASPNSEAALQPESATQPEAVPMPQPIDAPTAPIEPPKQPAAAPKGNSQAGFNPWEEPTLDGGDSVTQPIQPAGFESADPRKFETSPFLPDEDPVPIEEPDE